MHALPALTTCCVHVCRLLQGNATLLGKAIWGTTESYETFDSWSYGTARQSYVEANGSEKRVCKASWLTTGQRARRISLKVMEVMAVSSHYYDIVYKISSLTGMWPYLESRTRVFRMALLTIVLLTLLIPQVIVNGYYHSSHVWQMKEVFFCWKNFNACDISLSDSVSIYVQEKLALHLPGNDSLFTLYRDFNKDVHLSIQRWYRTFYITYTYTYIHIHVSRLNFPKYIWLKMTIAN